MLSDLKAILDIVDRISEKLKANQEEKTRNKVLVALFELGNEGRQGVSAENLETQGGFTKLEISQSIEWAKSQSWIIDYSHSQGMCWGLNPTSIYYVNGLLEKQSR